VTYSVAFGLFLQSDDAKRVDLLACACLSLSPHETIQDCETIAFFCYSDVYRPLTNLINIGRKKSLREARCSFVF
jgi:hypothetical protein